MRRCASGWSSRTRRSVAIPRASSPSRRRRRISGTRIWSRTTTSSAPNRAAGPHGGRAHTPIAIRSTSRSCCSVSWRRSRRSSSSRSASSSCRSGKPSLSPNRPRPSMSSQAGASVSAPGSAGTTWSTRRSVWSGATARGASRSRSKSFVFCGRRRSSTTRADGTASTAPA